MARPGCHGIPSRMYQCDNCTTGGKSNELYYIFLKAGIFSES